ncbi:MmyB family transcriptional regulator [Streptomyces sp. NPDC001340]
MPRYGPLGRPCRPAPRPRPAGGPERPRRCSRAGGPGASRRGRVSHLSHPQVGDLDLHSNKLSVDGTDGLTLVVFHAEPGSRSAELLGVLGSLTAPHPGARTERVEEQ